MFPDPSTATPLHLSQAGEPNCLVQPARVTGVADGEGPGVGGGDGVAVGEGVDVGVREGVEVATGVGVGVGVGVRVGVGVGLEQAATARSRRTASLVRR